MLHVIDALDMTIPPQASATESIVKPTIHLVERVNINGYTVLLLLPRLLLLFQCLLSVVPVHNKPMMRAPSILSNISCADS